MRWVQLEYVLKGIYLGLLLFVALQEPNIGGVELVALCTLGGLALALLLAATGKLRKGYRVRGKTFSFILFLLLESPELVYAGIVGGLAIGAHLIRRPGDESLMTASVVVGAFLGFVFGLLRRLRHRWGRMALVIVLAAGLAAAGLYYLNENPEHVTNKTLFGAHLLFGIPFFYVLTFAGRAEESEVEIGLICATAGAGLYLLNLTPAIRSIPFLVPVAVYYAYVTRVLPGLRVFKHGLRGHSHASVGKHREALTAFRRALELSPANKLAREGLWMVHRNMDLSQVGNDPEMLAMIDVDLCLGRAAALLIEAKPSEPRLQEARHLLDLVEKQRPVALPVVRYWRSVALLHQGQYEPAAQLLTQVIDPAQSPANDAHRQSVLFPAWQLALMGHGEMRTRVAEPQLEIPGRRLEAIAAVERQLKAEPEDGGAWDLKRLLYGSLTEAEYQTAGTDTPLPAFDYAYAQQLGLALIDDDGRWQRGAEYLRMAAHGLPVLGPSLFGQIAKAFERAGNAEGALHNYQLAQRAGRAVGPANLSDEDRKAFFHVVKHLGDTAAKAGDYDAAIDNYHLYTENENSGLETLRTLAELYERKGDPLSALRIVEKALIYDSGDKDLLQRKDKYYYSVTPEQLQAKLQWLRNAFDVPYCINKARSIVEAKNLSLEAMPDMAHWALHLAELAQVMEPANVTAMVLRARARLMRGERDEALVILEDLKCSKPEKFASGDDEDAWYVAHRLLGRMYMDELARPDLAIDAFLEFRKSAKSGADTLFRLGQAFEATGDMKKAARYYEQVTAYESHPLVSEAREALYRVQAETNRGVGSPE